MKSSDIDKSVSWYKSFLNCTVEYSDDTWAMLECNGTKIALVKEGTHPPHIAFKVESSIKIPCEKFMIKKHRDGSSYYYGTDPDGNIIEWVAYPQEQE